MSSQENPLPIKPISSLLSYNFPPTRWIVEGILPAEGLTIMSAAPGSFKTWVMLEIALSVTNDRKLFDTYETSKTSVLLVDEESGPRLLQERFNKLGAAKDLDVYYISRSGRKVTQEYIDDLLSVCVEKQIGLVMFDSLVRLHTGDENTSKDMSQLFDLFKQLTDNGLGILIAHHNRKSMPGSFNPSGDMRGSSDILAAVDCHMALSRQANSDYIAVQQTKNRYMKEVRPFKLRFNETNGMSAFHFMGEVKSKEDERNDIKEAIVAALSSTPGLTKKILHEELGEKCGVGLTRLGNLVDELESDGLINSTPGVRNSVHYTVATKNGSALKTQ